MFHVQRNRRFYRGTLERRRRYWQLSVDCLYGTRWNSTENAMEEGTMWIALFSIASAAAIGLSVAAVLLQARQGQALRG
jgi:hypothetical protein